MTKDEFVKKYREELSQIILELDENDDQSSELYDLVLGYRACSLGLLMEEFNFDSEKEMLEYLIDEFDGQILRAARAKDFFKKRLKTIKEATM